MGSAAAQTTGLLSPDTGISEDGDATLNWDTPQLGSQQCRRVGRSAPMSPLENTSYHPAFLGWGNWGEEGACFRPGSRLVRSEDQILVKVARPFPPPWVRGTGTGYVFRSREPLGSRGAGVRHPKSDNLVGHKRGPPAARPPARTDAATEVPGRRPGSRQGGTARVTCIISKMWFVSPYWGISGGMRCGAVVASMLRRGSPLPGDRRR